MSSIEQRSAHQCTTQLELIWEYTYMNFKVVDMWLESNQTTFLQSARVSNSGRSRQNSLGSTAKPVRYVSEVQILCLLWGEDKHGEIHCIAVSHEWGDGNAIFRERALNTYLFSESQRVTAAVSHQPQNWNPENGRHVMAQKWVTYYDSETGQKIMIWRRMRAVAAQLNLSPLPISAKSELR